MKEQDLLIGGARLFASVSGGNRTRQSAERDCLQAEAERAV